MRTQRKLVSYYEADRIARDTNKYSMKNVYKTSSKVLLNQKQATGKVETPDYMDNQIRHHPINRTPKLTP